MAVIDTLSELRGTIRAQARPAALFRRIAGAIIQWNDARATRNALKRLSLHQLDDIGLAPGDIDRLTRR